MKRLLRVELDRLRWRRAVRILLAACVLVPAVIWVATWWDTRPHSPEDIARAEAEIAAMADEQWFRDEMARCTERPEEFGIVGDVPGDVAEACRSMMLPTPEDYLYRPELSLEESIGGSATAVVTLLAALLLLVGTTFVGHDWNTGSMGNQLLFEPRRDRVWLAKAAVLLALAVVVSAVVLSAFWGGLWLLHGARDLPPEPGIGDTVRGAVLRAVVLCGGAAVIGYALTTLFRSTVATLGVVFVVTIAGTMLLAVLGGNSAEPWTLHANVSAWLNDGYEYWVDDFSCAGEEGCGIRTVTLAEGATYLGVVLAAACVASVVSFRRRDVP